jgi:hypothetical protein
MFPGEGFYGLLASDIVPQTPGWGKALATAVPPFGLSFCDDSIHGRTLPTHPCVSGQLVKALGWWAYPKARHNGIDVYLRELAYRFGGCVYLEEHKFLHNHHTAGRSFKDEVYERGDSYRTFDLAAGHEWHREGYANAVKSVILARGGQV